MTKLTLRIELTCNGKTLAMGPGEAIDINKITGLESSEIELGLSDLAVVDGSSLDGQHIKPRPIHIEASFRGLSHPEEKREQLVRFFNPKVTGTLTATRGKTSRSIEYALEGWTLKEQRNLDARVGFIADLICPDPYFYGEYRYADMNNWIENDGDAETGWVCELTGNFSNPRITNEQTGEYMRVEASVSGSDRLIISTEDRRQTITLNGESAFRLIDRGSTPFRLQPGSTRVTVRTDTGYIVGGVEFRPRYFGI